MHRWGITVAALLLALPVACSDDEPSADGGTTSTTAPVEATDVPPAVPLPPAPFGEADEPVVVGHRGAAGHHPDNSLEGFAAAAGLGASWVELDVRLSADGDAVLSHDPETAAGSVVTETSTADLAAEGLPTLAEALAVIDEHRLGVDVEIKSDPTEATFDPSLAVADATMAVLDGTPVAGPVVVTSFDRNVIDRVRELAGDRYPTALIAGGIGGADDLRTSLLDAGHDGVVLNHEAADAEILRTLSTGGLTLWSYTVDDPATAADLVAGGVSGIVTDLPDVISAALS